MDTGVSRSRVDQVFIFNCVKFGTFIKQLNKAVNNPFTVILSSKKNECHSK